MKNIINENPTKQTTERIADLALVTILSLSFPIESVEKTNTRRVLFVFKKSQKLKEVIESYWRCELRIEPQQFFNQLKIIKTRIYASQ